MIGVRGNKTTKKELMESNGKYILDSICTRRIVTESQEEYSLDATFVIDETLPQELYDLIAEDSLIYVDEEFGREYFRIAQVRKNKRSVDVFARHITISDILTMWLEDVRPTETNGNNSINWIFDNAKGENWFDVSSDIENINTAYYVNKNVYEALFTSDNAFITRWGGEVYRRGFNIAINKTIGKNRGVEIRNRKNLKGLEMSTNINSLCTRIYPVGFDGITINEKHIDSELIGNYSKVYAKKFKYENVKIKTEQDEEGYDTLEEAQEELKRLANLEFSQKKVDVITASYRVDFVELGKTEEYKNYSILEQTWLGDTIKVIDEELNIDINVRVTKRVYDCSKKERISTELSNKDTKVKPPTIQDIINKLEEIPVVDENKVLQAAKDNATALINAGLKDSYVIVRPNEILIMDSKDINTSIKVWRWNQGGLGFSSTGYYGEYGTAITNDGAIVADFITTGILNANLIKTGMLKSYNNLSWLNMQDGTFNLANKISFDGDTFNIDLSDKGLATEEYLSNQLDLTKEGFDASIKDTKEGLETQINATAKGVDLKISSIGGYNIVKNGNFENGLNGWWYSQNSSNGTEENVYITDDSSQWVLDGKKALTIRINNNTTGEIRVDSQKFKVKQNTDYTISYLIASHRVDLAGHYIRGNEWDLLATQSFKPDYGGKDINDWTKVTQTFNTGENYQINVNFNVYRTTDNSFTWVSDVMINEGKIDLAFTPNVEENISLQVSATAEGLEASIKDTREGLETQIKATSEEIATKVSNDTFESYERQTAEEFNRRVAKGEEFSTELTQNTEEFNFNIGQDGMNVNINKNGMKIGNGALTVVNSNGTITIDASKLMFRILTYGQGSVVIPNGSQTATATITHNLGYNPVFSGQIGYINTNGETEYYSDSLSLYNVGDGTVNFNVRMFVNRSELRIVAWRASRYVNSGTSTFYFRYFIQEGVSL